MTPVVGLVTPPFELSPDAFEVAEVFEVPLSFSWTKPITNCSGGGAGKLREYYAMPYGDYFIWGATAGMIVSPVDSSTVERTAFVLVRLVVS